MWLLCCVYKNKKHQCYWGTKQLLLVSPNLPLHTRCLKVNIKKAQKTQKEDKENSQEKELPPGLKVYTTYRVCCTQSHHVTHAIINLFLFVRQTKENNRNKAALSLTLIVIKCIIPIGSYPYILNKIRNNNNIISYNITITSIDIFMIIETQQMLYQPNCTIANQCCAIDHPNLCH